MRRIGFIGFLLLLCCGEGMAEERGSVSGFVTDAADGEGLIGASVYLEEILVGGTTNNSGYYVIPDIPAGEYTLICGYIGYQNFSERIEIHPGEDIKVDIDLAVEVLEGEETVVRADSMRTVEKLFRKTISKVELSALEIRQIPQVAEADLLRSLQTLPGILPLSDFSSALYVRGGTPDQNLYMIDGPDVYNPEHAFGIFSTFNTDAVKQVELSKGGFGAEYGGRLSSVLNVTNLDGNREEFEGSTSISLLSAKTTLQAPLGDRGSLSGSIRRTYFDQTVGRRLDNIPDYYFYDGNFKAFLDLGDNDKLTISGYGGRDFLKIIFNEDASSETGFGADWGNKTGSLRWTRIFTPRLFGNFWLTGSRFTSDFHFEEAEVEERNLVTDVTLKGNLEYHHSREWTAKFGFEQKNLHVLFAQPFAEGEVDIESRPEHYVTYLQGNWRPTRLLDVEAGLRYNLFRSDADFQNLDPRFSVKYRLSDKVNLKAATGIYHQYLHRVPRFIATDIWTTSNQFQEASRSVHYILGYQQELARNYQLEVETFYKTYNNIYSFNQTFLTELQPSRYDEENKPVFTETKGIFKRGDGHSMGLELLLRKDVGALSGWIGYSYSRTRHTFDGINGDEHFFPRHDRSSTFNLVSKIDVRNALRKLRGERKVRQQKGRWTLGGNLVYSTGQPFTEPGSGYITASDPGAPDRYVVYAPTKINNVRFPPYARLDVSLTYDRDFGDWSMSPFIQFFNIGNRKNVWFVEYEYAWGVPSVDENFMFPVLPTVGITFKF